MGLTRSAFIPSAALEKIRRGSRPSTPCPVVYEPAGLILYIFMN
jgi:hypothetical protein